MNILTWLIDPKNRTKILIGIIVILCLLVWKGCNDKNRLEAENLQTKNNLLAMKDTVRIEKTKSGEIQFVKDALIADMKSLKEMNLELYNEVKNQKKTIFYIAQMTASIRDSLKSQSSGDKAGKDPSTGADMLVWNFDTTGTDWSRKLNGKSLFTVKYDTSGKYTITPKFSVLENFEQKMKITTGLEASKTQKGMLEIFIRSSYPGMTFTDINGAVVNPEDFKKYLPTPKPKKFSVGPYIGVGYGVTLEKIPQLVPSINVGIGVQYKLFNF